MSTETFADKALENLKKMTECLEKANEVIGQHQHAIKDLQTIVKFQQERMDIMSSTIRALQSMTRNLDQRLTGERSLSA